MKLILTLREANPREDLPQAHTSRYCFYSARIQFLDVQLVHLFLSLCVYLQTRSNRSQPVSQRARSRKNHKNSITSFRLQTLLNHNTALSTRSLLTPASSLVVYTYPRPLGTYFTFFKSCAPPSQLLRPLSLSPSSPQPFNINLLTTSMRYLTSRNLDRQDTTTVDPRALKIVSTDVPSV